MLKCYTYKHMLLPRFALQILLSYHHHKWGIKWWARNREYWWVSFDIKFTRQGFENDCWHREACWDIENTRWVSFDIKFTRQGFENACWQCEACRDIENTRWVSFDIKFTRQGFENACWQCEAWRAIQHVFSKPSLVNLITKSQTWYSIDQFTSWITI